VKEWQQIAGWINWALNVYPLLQTALNNIYAKIRGKGQDARIWANKAIKEDLEWARKKVSVSDGVLLLKSLSWEVDEGTCVMETNACPEGMAFWCQVMKKGFALSTPPGTPANQIIFYEALAVLSALCNAHLTWPS